MQKLTSRLIVRYHIRKHAYSSIFQQRSSMLSSVNNSIANHYHLVAHLNSRFIHTRNITSFYTRTSNTEICSIANFQVYQQTNGVFVLSGLNATGSEGSDISLFKEEIELLNQNHVTIPNPTKALALLLLINRSKIDISQYASVILGIQVSIADLSHPNSYQSSSLFNCLQLLFTQNEAVSSIPYNCQPLVEEIFCILGRSLENQYSRDDVVFACLGFKGLSGTSIEEKRFVSNLSTILNNGNPIKLDSHAVASILTGIRTLDTNVPEVRQLYQSLVRHFIISDLIECNDNVLLDIIFGIQHLSGKYDEEIAIVDSIVANLVQMKRLSPELISILCYSIRNISSSSKESSNILSSFKKILNNHENVLYDSSSYSKIISSLHNFTGKTPNEIQYLSAIARLNITGYDTITSDLIDHMLRGIMNFTWKLVDERKLFATITKIMVSSADRLDGKALSNMFLIIRNLPSSYREDQEFISQVIKILNGSNHIILTNSQFDLCLVSLSYLTGKSEGRVKLLTSFVPLINNATQNRVLSSINETSKYIIDSQLLENILHILNYMNGTTEEDSAFLLSVKAYLDNSYCPLTNQLLSSIFNTISKLKVYIPAVQSLSESFAGIISSSPIVPLTSVTMSRICNGLQNFTGRGKGEKALIEALLRHLSSNSKILDYVMKSNNTAIHMNPKIVNMKTDSVGIAYVFTGLRKLHMPLSHVQDLLRLMHKYLEFNSNIRIRSNDAAKICSGLSSMQANSPEEIIYISYVINMLQNNNILFQDNWIGKAVSGLSLFRGAHPLERELIDMISRRIDTDISAECQRDSRFVQLLFYGIRRLKGKYEEEKRLLRIVNRLLSSSTVTLKPRMILEYATAIASKQFGLHDKDERLLLMDTLSSMIERSSLEPFQENMDNLLSHILDSIQGDYPEEERLRSLLLMRLSEKTKMVNVYNVDKNSDNSVIQIRN